MTCHKCGSKDSADYKSCTKCHDSSSSSSYSERSELRYPPRRKYCAREIKCIFGDGVVDIACEFILTAPGVAATAVPTTALGVNAGTSNLRTDVILKGNGFFVRGHNIVCPSALVLLPPSVNGVANRFPFAISGPLNPTTADPITSNMIRCSRILVTVNNVNGKGHAYVYVAQLEGVFGQGGFAVLRINHEDNFNAGNPCIKKEDHPFFKWGKSKRVRSGERCYLVGDFVSNQFNGNSRDATNAVVEGKIAQNRYLEPTGWGIYDSLLVTASVYANAIGLPILDACGRVLGMQLGNVASVIVPSTQATGESSGLGAVFGVSEYSMRHGLKAIFKGICHIKYQRVLNTVYDPAGTYVRVLAPYAGIAADVFEGYNFDTTVDYSITNGLAVMGAPRVRLDVNGNFVVVPPCKRIEGLRILGIAGLGNVVTSGQTSCLYFVPGLANTAAGSAGATVVNSTVAGTDIVNSPFLGALLPGDILLRAGAARETVPLGPRNHQTAPSLVLQKMIPGERFEVVIKRGGNVANTSGTLNDNTTIPQANYDDQFVFSGPLAVIPQLMDYPWLNVNIFPLILVANTATAPPGFFSLPAVTAGINPQITNPQYPQTTSTAGTAANSTGFFWPAF